MFLRSLLFLASTLTLMPGQADAAGASPVAASMNVATPIPLQATPRAKLETDAHSHHQVLRVKRDFGAPGRDIVVDAWVPKSGVAQLAEVRLWWVETSQGDIRKPFGKKTKRRVKVKYNKKDDTHWVVTFGAGSKSFDFDVELDAKGQPTVFGDIKDGRKKVDHCEVQNARLFAKKMLDVTVGLDRLEVDCVDAKGVKHSGNLRRS